MKILLSIAFVLCLHVLNTTGFGQIIHKSGYIYSEVASSISSMPLDSGDHYTEPDTLQLNTWGNTLHSLLIGNYTLASDSANAIGYRLINFTDTFTAPHTTYYILEAADSNYWGTYVYNPNYCRSLVIQSPHSRKDANTGHQGIHVFRKTQAMFFQVNGTHRCNSSVYSSCSGTTTICSGTSTSEPYRISDLAHTTQSLFQKTTEVLFHSFGSTYFIQLHGFTRQSTDPYAILSNGTQQTPSPDYMPSFTDNLFKEDSVLTFKVAHIDTSWTRLRGFWNTQGRLINGSSNPCNTNAVATSGRFIHIEQERSRLRSDVSGWNKVANALRNTFECSPVSHVESIIPEQAYVYPNPTTYSLHIEWDGPDGINREEFIYNLLGQNMSKHVRIIREHPGKAIADVSRLSSGIYLVMLKHSVVMIYKY